MVTSCHHLSLAFTTEGDEAPLLLFFSPAYLPTLLGGEKFRGGEVNLNYPPLISGAKRPPTRTLCVGGRFAPDRNEFGPEGGPRGPRGPRGPNLFRLVSPHPRG